MKPWLFDILACPMDKFYPLKLYIFSYDTPETQFESFLQVFNEKDIEKIEKESVIEIEKNETGFLIKDEIVIKKLPLDKYLDLIIKSIGELNNFYDRSKNVLSLKCFELLATTVKERIINFSKKAEISKISEILPELYLLNKIKLDIEIESGLLFCEECKRWFPIIESIPQLLPDDYREREKDLIFLKNHKNLFDPEFFQQNLKPYNL